jgi:hypothetical protein
MTFRKEIDLGDGSGVQVFEADTPDGLVNMIREARRAAEAKFVPQPAQKSEPPAPVPLDTPPVRIKWPKPDVE